jgi:hypothetical protein
LQKISFERCNEGPRVAFVTRGGTITRFDMKNEGNNIEQWVRKSSGPIPTIDPQK